MRIFGFEITVKIRRVKRVNISIPDWADDAHVNSKGESVYYKGTRKFVNQVAASGIEYDPVKIFRSPLYDRPNKCYAKDRIMIYDLYYQ